jgi:thiol-disulfide isomerase/thioredoxin
MLANPEAEAAAAAMVSQPRPAYVLPDLAGTAHSAEEWDGKVVVVNFWATWCKPCLREMPDFIDMQNLYAGQGLQFVGIALDDPAKVRDFVDEMGVDYPIHKAEKVSIAYGNEFGALPYTVVIDRNGVIADAHRGEVAREKVENMILSLL